MTEKKTKPDYLVQAESEVALIRRLARIVDTVDKAVAFRALGTIMVSLQQDLMEAGNPPPATVRPASMPPTPSVMPPPATEPAVETSSAPGL